MTVAPRRVSTRSENTWRVQWRGTSAYSASMCDSPPPSTITSGSTTLMTPASAARGAPHSARASPRNPRRRSPRAATIVRRERLDAAVATVVGARARAGEIRLDAAAACRSSTAAGRSRPRRGQRVVAPLAGDRVRPVEHATVAPRGRRRRRCRGSRRTPPRAPRRGAVDALRTARSSWRRWRCAPRAPSARSRSSRERPAVEAHGSWSCEAAVDARRGARACRRRRCTRAELAPRRRAPGRATAATIAS